MKNLLKPRLLPGGSSAVGGEGECVTKNYHSLRPLAHKFHCNAQTIKDGLLPENRLTLFL